MKNLILIALVCVGQIFTTTAQNTPTNPTTSYNSSTSTNPMTMSDYERMLNNQQKTEFKAEIEKTLGLTAQQIKDFEPMYKRYMEDKAKLAQAKMDLLNKYSDRMDENDSQAKLENKKEEFMEDYLELQTAEMKLRKENFDRMEDAITADKAFGFYLLEDIAAGPSYEQIFSTQFAPFVGQRDYNSSGNLSNNSAGNMNDRTTTTNPSSTTDRSNVNSTNPNNVTDPAYRAATQSTNSTSNSSSTIDRSNQNPPTSTNSANPNSNAIVTDPASNARTYQDKPVVNRDNTTVTPPNTATTTRTAPNAPSPTTSRTTTSIDSTTNTRTAAMPTNTTNGNMNNSNYAGSTSTTTTTTAKSVDSRYRTDIDTYINWYKTTNAVYDDGHDYVAENLNKMAAAISALSMSCTNTSNDKTMTSNKNKIMANAKELQVDPHSMTHSRLMRESFIAAADMMKSVQQACGQSTNSSAVTQMADAARKLDTSKTTNSQEQLIRDFFQKAQTAINGMSNGMNWSGNK